MCLSYNNLTSPTINRAALTNLTQKLDDEFRVCYATTLHQSQLVERGINKIVY